MIGRNITLSAASLAFVAAAATLPQAVDVHKIIQQSDEAMLVDWNAAPNYSYIEHDIDTKHGREKTVKTYQVVMIDGSPYNQLIGINNQPLSPQQQAKEEKKLQAEIQRRSHESLNERARRVAKYQKERHQDHEMMEQMTKAFNFTLTGEGVIDGHEVWIFDANPNTSYQPINTEAKVLIGMKGRLWVDQKTHQWVKVQAEVIRPVSFFGFLAKVQPGTRFLLEQEPVAPGLWLPKHFITDVNAAALGFIDESSTTDTTYRDYKPMAQVAELLHIPAP